MSRTCRGRLALVAAVLSGAACHSDIENADPTSVARVSPATVSSQEAWRLFDRSTSSAFKPGVEAVRLTFDRAEQLSFIKVYGAAPYRLHVASAAGTSLGFDEIDLSALGSGWHAFPSSSLIATSDAALSFEQLGTAAPVPEVELWAVADEATPAHPDLTARDLPRGFVAAASDNTDAAIEPGSCASFPVDLARVPSTFKRTYLAYDARGLFRSFGLRRTVNGRAEQVGAWLAGDQATRTFVDEFDPAALLLGSNEVRLCVPTSAPVSAHISNLRIVGETDRRVALGASIQIGTDARDGALLLDGDTSTTLDVAAGERVVLAFDRLIAPDAIVLTGRTSDDASVECLDQLGATQPIASKPAKTTTGAILALDGGALACMQIAITSTKSASLGEIEVVGSGAAEPVDWPRIVVTSANEHFGDTAWVGGFVARPPVMKGAIRMTVAGQSSTAATGDFGQLISRTDDPSGSWSVVVGARLPNGSTQTRQVILDRDQRGQLTAARANTAAATSTAPDNAAARFGRPGDSVVIKASPVSTTTIKLGTRIGATVPAGALAQPTAITVNHLGDDALPELEPGMINVTAPKGHGYEFLPHAQRFSKAIDVAVPFEPTLIPEDMKPEDVHTYYFDPVAQHWKRLDRTAIDVGEHVIHSATDHFTIMIDAVLTVPKNPTPLAFDPTTLSSIGAASPAANIDVIEPPQASSTGDARLSLPIRLPKGRGAYSPSLALTYSSSGGNGWLGVGWDLATSHVEIDSRWGVPSYADGDSPRYLLDGAELVPSDEPAEGPTCDNPRRYRARIEGAFAHILRCGADPASYHWEVHDRDGTLYVYGDTVDSRLASYEDLNTHHGIFRWGLSRVVDVHQNTTQLTYTVDELSALGTETSRELYPAQIIYTSGHGQPAVYTVTFERDDGQRPDRIISGRSGFKMVTRSLLRFIHVAYRGTVFRDYVLTYKSGQFDKSVLTSVDVYGGACGASSHAFTAPSCATVPFLDRHTFDWFTETQGFDEPVAWNVTGDPDPPDSSLGRGHSSSTSESIGLGVKASSSLNIGGSVSHNGTDRSELIGIYDVNSDGLPDQLFYNPGFPPFVAPSLRVLYNQGAADRNPTAHPLLTQTAEQVIDLPALGSDSQSTWGLGFNLAATYGVSGVHLGAGFSDTTARANQMVTDLDGDGYIDLLLGNGTAYFGRPCPQGLCFTQGPFGATQSIDPRADQLLNLLETQVKQGSIIADPVVQWVAPWSGTITVTGTARKVRAGGTDGVTIEAYNGDTRIDQLAIAPGDTDAHQFPATTTLSVSAGDAIYLRVETGADDGITRDGTLDDLVDAGLEVTYTHACTQVGCADVDATVAHEPTGTPVFAFDSKSDLRVAGAPIPLVIAATGTLELHANVVKPSTTDAVRVCVERFARVDLLVNSNLDRPCSANDQDVTDASGISNFAAGATSMPIDLSLPVAAGQLVVLRVEADLSFDPAGIAIQQQPSAQPIVSYSTVCSLTGDDCRTDAVSLASAPLAAANWGAYAAVSTAAPAIPFVATGAGTLHVADFTAPNEAFVFAVRSDKQGTVWRQDCTNVSCTGTISVTPFAVAVGESVTFEIVTADGTFASSSLSAYLNDPNTSFTVPVAIRTLDVSHDPDVFAGGYRGFRAAFWNESETFAPATVLADAADPLTPAARLTEIAKTLIPPLAVVNGTAVTGNEPAWVAPLTASFVGAAGWSAAYVGLDPDSSILGNIAGIYDSGYTRLSGTFSYYLSGGATVSVDGINIGADVSASAGSTDTTTDIVDMNGDGVADVIASDQVWLGAFTTNPLGAGKQPGFHPGPTLRHRDERDYSVGFGGKATNCQIKSSGLPIQCSNPDGPDTGTLGLGAGKGLAVARTQTTQDLADLNGDGLPDIVSRDPDGTIEVQLNLGNHFGAKEPYGSVAAALRAPLDAFQAYEAVKNGYSLDSTSSALQHETTITTTESGGFNFVVVDCSHSSSHTSARISRQLADINGDGMPDLLWKQDGEAVVHVQINRGGSFADATTWNIPNGWPSPIDLHGSLSGVDSEILGWLGGLGVGGPDVLAGTSTQDGSSNGCNVSIPIYGPLSLQLGLTVSGSNDTYELTLLDVDGDGTADHVLRAGRDGDQDHVFVKQNLLTGRANLLQAVHRPLGATIALDYTRAGNTVDMPRSRQVLSRVEIDDGVDLGPDFASPNVVTKIGYEHGFFDRNEKEFYGFSKVTTTRVDGTDATLDIVEDAYENATYPLHGRLITETRRDSTGRLFRQHAIHYALQGVLGSDGAALGAAVSCADHLHPLLARVGSAPCTPVFPVVTRDDNTRAEGGFAQKTQTTLDGDRDRFGNELTSSDTGDDAVIGDETVVSATYSNDTTNWILGRANTIEVRNGAGALLRHRTGTYDSFGDPVEISVDTGSGLATTTLSYDQFGNLATLTTPPNEAGQTQAYRIDYDRDAAIYPTSVIDSFLLQSTAEYDVRFGVATKEVDTNGSVLTRRLDAFGRITQVQGPYDTAATTQGLFNQYFPDESPPRARTLMTPTAPPGYTGPIPQQMVAVTLIDGLGRVVEQRKTSVVDGTQGMTTSGLVVRDAFGRVVVTQNPFFGVSLVDGFVPPQVTAQTRIAYDVLDRPIQTTYADGAIDRTIFDIAADPDGRLMFVSRAIDPNGHGRETYTDQLGRTRAFVEHPTAAGSPSVTRYDYLASGELSQIADAEGHSTALGYDLRGLRTSLQNADYGLIEDRYDAMGNRIALVEPNHRALGTRVHYVYDHDRLVSIDYPSKPDVTFTYGAPGAPNFGAGRVVAVADETGTQQHEYGALGEPRRTVRTVVAGSQTYTFDLHLTSDSFGRQLQVGYPDGEVVTNQYDAAGMLNVVTGVGTGWTRTYASDIRYDVFGNRSHMVYGNGAVSNWTYDPARIRLSSVSTTLSSGTALQALQYSYDAASNPIQIENRLPALTGGSGTTPGYSKLTLAYDGVDRLLSAIGNAQLDAQKTTFYDQESTYSASHNLLHKQRLHTITASSGSVSTPVTTNFAQDYTYGSRPHLPTNIDGLAITYDPSGNPLDRLKVGTSSVLTLTWDDDNRMTDATGSSVNQHNSYDASGNRVRRKSTQSETIFSSQYFDLDNGTQGTKHVFAGTTRVASELGKFIGGVNPVAPSKQGTAYFFHSDHLASTHVLTDDKGGIQESLEYFADGEMWIDRGPQTPVTGYLFSGKPMDPDTGFYDFGQRFYDPRSSLWLGLDSAFKDKPELARTKPVLLAPLGYAAHSPVANTDPDGRCPVCVGVFLFLWATENEAGDNAKPELSTADITVIGLSFVAGGAVAGRLGGLRGAAFGGATGSLVNQAGEDIVHGEFSGFRAYGKVAVHGVATGVLFHGASRALGSQIGTSLSAEAEVSPEPPETTAPSTTRLPQDIAIEANRPRPPRVLPWNRPISRSAAQQGELQDDIRAARAAGARDIRVNQQQVDASGKRVGINRPDLQFTTRFGQRVYVEYDSPSSTRGPGHAERIIANDPSGVVILKTIP